jgi:hypothetical protein
MRNPIRLRCTALALALVIAAGLRADATRAQSAPDDVGFEQLVRDFCGAVAERC